jgi:multiple sugar transport system permease protein
MKLGWDRVLIYAAAALFAGATLLPILWIAIVSISPAADLTERPLRLWPSAVHFGNYAKLFSLEENGPGFAFLSALRNSAIIAGLATIVAMAVAIPAAWAFARSKGHFDNLLLLVLATYMMPSVALLLPLYFALSALGLLNSLAGLVIVYSSILVPFVTWFASSALAAVPEEIEAAARLEGASFLKMLALITLPLAKGGLATTALFAILLSWDEFFYALLFTSNIDAKTLPVTIADFAGGRATDFGLIAASGLLTALPPVLIAVFLQKALVSGVTAGGIKG